MSRLPHLPTYQNDLSIFVGELRDLLFFSQEEAAVHFHLDRSRISRYESGKAIPKIGYVAELARLLAEQTGNEPDVQRLLLGEVNRVLASRSYRKSRFQDWAALCQTAQSYLADQQAKPRTQPPASQNKWLTTLEQRFDLPSAVPLIGIEVHLNRLMEIIAAPERLWVVCIEGLGGIGKTSLANALIRHPELPALFRNPAWVSAKQQNLIPGVGLAEISGPVRATDMLIDALLEQLDSTISLAQPLAQKQTALTKILKEAPHLIVIDNLETLAGYQSLPPTLLKWANPSKFLLTSRHSLRLHPEVYSFTLTELEHSHTLHFLRQEMAARGLSAEIKPSEEQLNSVYEVVGGPPPGPQASGRTNVRAGAAPNHRQSTNRAGQAH